MFSVGHPTSPATVSRSGIFRLGGMVAAIPIVVAGTSVLENIGRFGPARAHLYGGLLLLAGAIVFGALARQLPVSRAALEPPLEPPASQIRGAWMWSWTALALIAAAYTMLHFIKKGEDYSVHIAWLASIASLFVGQLYSRSLPVGVRPGNLHISILLLLLAAALWSRIYHLGMLPYNLDGDYADFGIQARAIALGQEQRWFGFGWAAIPMIGYMPAALTMRVAGPGLEGLYLAGVVEGWLSIVGVYLLGRDLFGPRTGLLATALLTISYILLHFSRTCAYIDPVFFTVWGLYFLVQALRYGSGLAAVASGALIALDLEMYYSGRAVAPIAIFAMALFVFRSRRWLLARWRELALIILAIIIVLGPMIYLFAVNHDAFVSRGRDVLIVTPDPLKHMKSVYQVDSLLDVFKKQAERAVLLFWTYTDSSTQFGARRPFLDRFSGVALALGVGYAVFTLRRLGSALSLGWLALILFLGCFLTINPPFFPRLVVLAAPAALLGGIALDRLAFSLETILPGQQIPFLGRLVTGGILAIALMLVGIANWTWYVNDFGSWATSGSRLARYLAENPDLRAYSVAVPSWWASTREFRFLAPGQLIGDLDPDLVAQGKFDPSATLVLSPDRAALVRKLKSQHPDAVVETHPGNSLREVAFFVFRGRAARAVRKDAGSRPSPGNPW